MDENRVVAAIAINMLFILDYFLLYTIQSICSILSVYFLEQQRFPTTIHF